MNKSKDPFEAAYEEQEEEEEEETPPESPVGADDLVLATDTSSAPAAPASQDPDESAVAQEEDGDIGPASGGGVVHSGGGRSATTTPMLMGDRHNKGKTISANAKEDYDDDEEDNMDVELSKFPSSADPHKMAKMQAILSQFTEEQMSRYESFRRSALQRANMRRLLVSITGTQKISLPMTIVVCGIAKMFVGELVETARIVMTERKESGPIRPCHVREAYRRLKLEGKVPKRSVPRLFR